jgi:PIN domain nuclease of toxin-antitoxin system
MAIFDAAPLAAVLLGETGGLASGRMLADPGHAVCAVNAAEVVDTVSRARRQPARVVASAVQLWIDAGLRIVPLDWSRAVRAAELRSTHYHRTRCAVSLADCGAVALAEQLGLELVTADAPMIRVARSIGVEVIPVPDSSGRTPK